MLILFLMVIVILIILIFYMVLRKPKENKANDSKVEKIETLTYEQFEQLLQHALKDPKKIEDLKKNIQNTLRHAVKTGDMKTSRNCNIQLKALDDLDKKKGN